jgi:hypothetical protein
MGERVILREGSSWVIPEKIRTPPTEEISAVRRGKKKIVSHNSKCIRTYSGGRGLTFNFLCSVGVVWMFSGMTHL